MTIEQAEQLVDELRSIGAEVSLRYDYSGRGMYGATCPALVFRNSYEVSELGFAAANIAMDSQDMPRRRDDMGLGIVVY